MAEKSKKSLRERLAAKRKELDERGSKGNIFFPKVGTTRIRVLPVESEEDWAIEVTSFYLNETIKGIISPATFGKPCPVMELYEELKGSKKDSDKKLAKKLIPKKKYLVAGIIYTDDRGKEVDTEAGIKLIQLTTGVYGEMIDYYLDPEQGDFTDATEGYDFKIKRVGTGKMDTTYTCMPCKPSALPKKYAKSTVNLEEMVKAIIPSYEELEEKLSGFEIDADDDEDDKPKKKKRRDDDDEDMPRKKKRQVEEDDDDEEEEAPRKKSKKK